MSEMNTAEWRRDIATPEGSRVAIAMTRAVREALGMFAGAMPITPREAFEQALEEARRLIGGGDEGLRPPWGSSVRLVRTDEGGQVVDAGMVQVGWVKWDGDEFFDLLYCSPNDRGAPARDGFMPVYVEKPEGFDPRED